MYNIKKEKMKSFYDKDDYTTEDILSLITNEVEESIYLDFKECRALDKSDSVKRDISKDVSSFANSDGGMIIYGIKEENHKASSLSFIDGNVYTKEWLEHHRVSMFCSQCPSENIKQEIYLNFIVHAILILMPQTAQQSAKYQNLPQSDAQPALRDGSS